PTRSLSGMPKIPDIQLTPPNRLNRLMRSFASRLHTALLLPAVTSSTLPTFACQADRSNQVGADIGADLGAESPQEAEGNEDAEDNDAAEAMEDGEDSESGDGDADMGDGDGDNEEDTETMGGEG